MQLDNSKSGMSLPDSDWKIGKDDCDASCHKQLLSFSRGVSSCSWVTNGKVQHFLRKSCTVHHQLISFVVILSKSCTVHHQFNFFHCDSQQVLYRSSSAQFLSL
jgi:hypothetical protein